MKKNKFLLFLFIITTLSCSTEENPDPEVTNSPPENFELFKIENNKLDVKLNPVLSWSEAIDPDGDAVSYSVLIDRNSEPSTIVAQNINSNSYTIEEPLQKCTTYYWQIIAEDSNGYTTKSEIFKFETYAINFENVVVSSVADFSSRAGHSTSAFKNQLWVIGGDIGALFKTNSVWASNNGVDWENINSTPPFEARSEHSALVFKDKIWIIAGRGSGNSDDIDRNDVWNTENGVEWTEVSSSADFSKRFGQGAVVFQNKMWIVGGFDGEYLNDVWSSEDGKNWNQITASTAFSGRVSHSLLVLNDKLWLIGGRDAEGSRKNDVWSSEDGINWIEVISNAPFTPRSLHGSIAFCDKLWVIGGASGSDWRNDVWYSEDGEKWNQVEEEIPFIGRHSHTVTWFKDNLWIIGGLGSDYNLKNDVIAIQ
jgi:N-acetylneuraminic acid mutarotase|nr:kelch repeat-containing protein [uncultured Allomuricauda sp.]